MPQVTALRSFGKSYHMVSWFYIQQLLLRLIVTRPSIRRSQRKLNVYQINGKFCSQAIIPSFLSKLVFTVQNISAVHSHCDFLCVLALSVLVSSLSCAYEKETILKLFYRRKLYPQSQEYLCALGYFNCVSKCRHRLFS